MTLCLLDTTRARWDLAHTCTAAAFSWASSISESMPSDPSDTSSARCRCCCCVSCWRPASDVRVTPAPASGAAAGSPFADGAVVVGSPEGGGGAVLLFASAFPPAPPESTADAVASTARCMVKTCCQDAGPLGVTPSTLLVDQSLKCNCAVT